MPINTITRKESLYIMEEKYMYNYELYLTHDVNGKSVFLVHTDHKMSELDKWLTTLVNERTITKDIAQSVLFVA